MINLITLYWQYYRGFGFYACSHEHHTINGYRYVYYHSNEDNRFWRLVKVTNWVRGAPIYRDDNPDQIDDDITSAINTIRRTDVFNITAEQMDIMINQMYLMSTDQNRQLATKIINFKNDTLLRMNRHAEFGLHRGEYMFDADRNR